MQRFFSFLRKKMGYERSVYDLIAPHLNGGKVLSVGCGEGVVEKRLKDNVGIDVQGVEVTKYRNHRIQTEMYDGKSLPFKNKSFDHVLFVYVLHHTNNIECLVSEGRRVAKKSVIILDHTYTNSFSKLLLKAYDFSVNIAYHMPTPLNFLKISEWRNLFDRLGLEVVQSSVPTSLNVMFKLRSKTTTR